MEYFNNNKPSIRKAFRTRFFVIAFVLCCTFAFLVGSDFNEIRITSGLINSSHIKSNEGTSTSKKESIDSFSYGHNSTHIWSMRYADENYFRLARILPCRTVEYVGGPAIDEIDSCDQSPTNEYSIENTLNAQKWLYEHQHPLDCTNRRFAIIRNFALSGFGSTVHQIAWAFGVAIAEKRIAVYGTPGNWVRY